MSADNWTICPNCKIAHDEAIAAHKREVNEAYGNVSPQEYLTMLAWKDPELPESLREDYEIGMCDGERFEVSYRCSCECGFSFGYKYEEVATLRKQK